MRVGFAGTPEFAACALSAIHEHGYTIALVLTQPDRPSGRGLALAAPAVKRYAIEHRLALLQPPTLKSPAAVAELARIPLDVLVVAAYGLILPRAVLAWPRHGGLNIHASLLPRWRGAAPIARAIEAGDATSGITIMQMDEGLDTGPIIAQRALAVDARETAGSLHDRLAALGARMIVETLDRLADDAMLRRTPQPTAGVTYAAKIERADTLIDWTQPATAIDRRIRALSPLPGAVAGWRATPIRIRGAMPLDAQSDREPGTVVAVGRQGIDVACARGEYAGILRLTELQPAAGRAMSAAAFAAGRAIAPGARFEPGQ